MPPPGSGDGQIDPEVLAQLAAQAGQDPNAQGTVAPGDPSAQAGVDPAAMAPGDVPPPQGMDPAAGQVAPMDVPGGPPQGAAPQIDPATGQPIPPEEEDQDDEDLNDPESYYQDPDDETGDDTNADASGDPDEQQPIRKGMIDMPTPPAAPYLTGTREIAEIVEAAVAKALQPFTLKTNELIGTVNEQGVKLDSVTKALAEQGDVVKALQTPAAPVVPTTSSVVPEKPEASDGTDVSKGLAPAKETISPAVVTLEPNATPAKTNPSQLIMKAKAIRDDNRVPHDKKVDLVKALRDVQTNGNTSDGAIAALNAQIGALEGVK